MPRVVNHEQRRAEIAQIAAELIAEDGLEAATIREIARRSGYSKGIIEHYFDGKSELIDAALGWANERYIERAGTATKHLQGLAALRARLRASVPSSPGLRVEWKIRLLFWSMAAIDPALQKQQRARTRDAIAHFASDLRDAQKLGEIPREAPVELLARRILFSVSGLSCAILHTPRTYNKGLVEDEIEYIVSVSTLQPQRL
ncbi:MAG: TetR family transcriptional regulator [Deltaproteobacteria bacterium]|nr:TetR family transcriptional regulator [Deltaproteobacteria bacterium]